ncbi:MAG: hypothetical protein AMJ69_08235 [Gammaproteobacteria bacterium SG8_47]|nr:MAG: hypothetical protein AMJ69_08235 [Gammaproteobacteria bacterium SG8_47]
MRYLSAGIFAVTLSFGSAAQSNPVVDKLLDGYAQQGAGPFSATDGKRLWSTRFAGPDGERECASCHTVDPRQAGRHAQTGKAIEPLAPSVNAARFTDPGKVAKWLKRNCKWTLGRECSAQENGDLLSYLTTL